MRYIKKHQCILESFRRGELIDEDIYNIASQTPIEGLTKTMLNNLRYTGLTEDQEIVRRNKESKKAEYLKM